MARLLFRVGAAAYRRPALFIVVWLVVLIGAGVGAGRLAGNTVDTFSLPGQESVEAMDLIKREFGGGGGDTASARVVVKAPQGQTLTTEANTAAVGELVTRLGGLDGVASATDPLRPTPTALSPDLTTAYSTVTYDVSAFDLTAEQHDALADAVAGARTGGLTVEASGDAVGVGGGGAHSTELIGVLAALVVLAVTYGALAVAGMNLLTALVGVGVGVCGIQIATGFVDLTASTPLLATMLGLAVGIDYALFIVSRFRHELRRGQDVGAAVATSVGTAGAAVVTAGLTVVIALVGLFVTGIPFLTQMGVAGAFTIVIAVLIATTLVPAVLALLGRRALPRKERDAPTTVHRDRGFFRGWVVGVTRRRVVALVLTTAALGALSIPLFSLQTTLAVTPTESTTQGRAELLLADAFGAGFNGPLTVFFDGEGAPRAATDAKADLAALPDVVAVTDPVPNADGTAALLTVVPESGPASAATERLVHDIRDRLRGDGPRAYVTGQTAVSVDVAGTVNAALPGYLALVVGLAFVLLVLVFRSLLVPLVGVLGFLLTIGSALGSSVAIFQWGWFGDLFGVDNPGPLISLTPILVVGILFGLAMDYQVFLVSRMHEAHGGGEPNTAAIRTGFRQAAPVVVAAAVIMFAVFAGFFPGADATMMSIAFALAAGILVDAFVVRMVLVPAAMALLGERAWWLPRWLSRLPRLDVEGATLQPREPEHEEHLTAAVR
ncbi:MMPL family transporter [Umezawaea tangerina]|uniref:RND superfamily putative drug exporter n=1 Tax=Umezawaea tangerina TaxID=84725 RepID=A0A2T0T6Y7_9PSEU|nr:MMPL family transporter [Umezawaea tangerina]PRY41392.1 RND superfamily putative drug exporter [Umezawaea tangerina]